ncbi:MAG: gamma-glutamylcyclotransferase, partial [Myxococcota bacterium]
MTSHGLWVFGYGSLVWRPGFPHRSRRPAWVGGFRRRFWQGSTDHRGIPGAPGRVVTLVRDTRAERCWGMAYQLEAPEVDDVLAGLDQREKGGYERVEVQLHFADPGTPASCSGLLYLAAPTNPNYLGPASLEAIASQVLASSGPSGNNLEY